jgi:hypothetical protein
MEGCCMTTYTTFEADGIDFICPVTFAALPGATTLTGGTVAVDAINLVTKAKTAGVATIASSTSIRCTIEGWTLAPGNYSVQVRATPAGYAEQTVTDATFNVKASAGPGP